MRGMARAAMRLVLMVLVMGGVLVTADAVGVPAAAVLGLAVIAAGLVGLVGVSRRGASRHRPAGAPMPVLVPAPAPGSVAIADPDATSDPAVAAMAPEAVVDPESLLPRWRRPSLLAARRADPTRVARVGRTPMRFAVDADPSPNRRVVRYAMVALLDRPDEVLGHQVSDLMSGDEVEVLDNGSSYWEVLCPDGQRGWVHRTTLGMVTADHLTLGRRPEPAVEPDDILTAVLSARGIQ